MKTVLITGASSGIGKEMALLFAAKGYNEVLVARRTNLLNEVKDEITDKYDVDVRCFTCDIAEDPRATYQFCKFNNIKVDVLVNNAGYGDYGKFIDEDLDKALGMIELNNKALVALTYYFIKDMKENGGGHILNVGSIASFMPGPYMAVYYATKAFVLSFSSAIREELRHDNIKVTVLCPGPTKSPFWEAAGVGTSDAYNSVFARTSLQAAKTGMQAFEKNKLYSVDGFIYKLLRILVKISPISLSARIVCFVQSRTKKAN